MREKPHRVLYIANSPTFVGGAERSLYELLKYMDRNQITPFYASIYDSDFTAKIRALDIQTLRLNPFNKRQPLPFLKSCRTLMRFIREKQIDFVHNNRAADAFYSFLPAKMTRTPLIIHHRDSSFTRLERFLTKRANTNICISNWQQQTYLNPEVVLIHNGLDLQRFQPASPQEIASAKVALGYADDAFIVGMFSRIAPIKGQDVLIRAAKTLAASLPQINYVIVGGATSEKDKCYLAHLKRLICENGLEATFKFTGFIEDISAIVKAFDLVVMPATREPFGRTAIEAMALEKPVICTNTGGFLDIVTPETGIRIPVDNATTLADAITALYHDPERRVRMGQAGRVRVIENFSVQSKLGRLYALYEKVAGSPQP